MVLVQMQSVGVGQRLRNAGLSLSAGEIIGLIGPNGAGKSTLLNALAGIVPFEGDVQLQGQAFHTLSARQRARWLALQPQSANSAWPISVRDVVALGRLPWGDNNTDAVQSAMDRAGISHMAQRKVDELSGGERARVWLARVLAGQPKILLSDEPVASLDIHYQIAVMDVLRHYAREGQGVIIALHDLSLAARYCDRLCLLNAGEIITQGIPPEVLDEALLSEIYGIAIQVDLRREPPVVLAR